MDLSSAQSIGAAAANRVPRTERVAPAQGEFRVSGPGGDVPDMPPAEVWEEIDHAGRVWEALHARGRELHFEPDKATGRVVIEVRDLDGNVLKTIPPAKAIDIAAGGR